MFFHPCEEKLPLPAVPFPEEPFETPFCRLCLNFLTHRKILDTILAAGAVCLYCQYSVTVRLPWGNISLQIKLYMGIINGLVQKKIKSM
jgi:hypothetical protein